MKIDFEISPVGGGLMRMRARLIFTICMLSIAARVRADDTCELSGAITLNGAAPAIGTPGRCIDNFTNPGFTTGANGSYHCTVQEGSVVLELNGTSDGSCPRACLTPPGTETCTANIQTSGGGCNNATVMFSFVMLPGSLFGRRLFRRKLGRPGATRTRQARLLVVIVAAIVGTSAWAPLARAGACEDRDAQILEYLKAWNGAGGADITKAISEVGFVRDFGRGLSMHDDPRVFDGGKPTESFTARKKLSLHIAYLRSLFKTPLEVTEQYRFNVLDEAGAEDGACTIHWKAVGKLDPKFGMKTDVEIQGVSVLTFDAEGLISSERVMP